MARLRNSSKSLSQIEPSNLRFPDVAQERPGRNAAMNQTQTQIQTMDLELELDPLDDFVRVPGLLRRWELEQVVTSGAEYRIEEAGELSDKTQVFAVYRRE